MGVMLRMSYRVVEGGLADGRECATRHGRRGERLRLAVVVLAVGGQVQGHVEGTRAEARAAARGRHTAHQACNTEKQRADEGVRTAATRKAVPVRSVEEALSRLTGDV